MNNKIYFKAIKPQDWLNLPFSKKEFNKLLVRKDIVDPKYKGNDFGFDSEGCVYFLNSLGQFTFLSDFILDQLSKHLIEVDIVTFFNMLNGFYNDDYEIY